MDPEKTCPRCAARVPGAAAACGQCGLAFATVVPGAGGLPFGGARQPLPSVQQAYGAGAFVGSGRSGPIDHPDGTTVLVLGILSLVFCQLFGPFAWSKGNKAMRQINANPGRYSNRGTVQAGRILGIITSCVLMLVVAGAIAGVVVAFVRGGVVDDSGADRHACLTEQATILTAAQAWTARHGTPPTSVDQLVAPQGPLNENSGNFRLAVMSGGTALEVIAVPGGDCA